MATQDLKTHSDLGEVAPAATDAIGLWRGAAGAQTLGWVEVGDLIAPTITGRSLALGAGTLTPATGFAGLTDIFVLNGTAAAAFELTVADGTVVNQQIQVIVIGDVDVYLVEISDTTDVFSRVQNGDNFTAWWTGTGWTRREMSKTWRPVVFGDGSPIGVLRPEGVGQVYFDELTDEKYLATGLANTGWSLFESASDSFTTSDDANTAITIGAAPNTHKRLTSSSAITLTLSATAAVGTKQSVVKKGSGTITAQVTGSSTYKLPGDTAGRTASFVISGYGFFECVANSGGSAAEWDFTGESDHADTLDNPIAGAGQIISDTQQPLADTQVTSSRDFALTDARQKMLRVDSGSAVTMTVRLNATIAFEIGTLLTLVRWGAGTLTIAAEGGVTLNKPSDRALTARAQYSAISLWKQATNTWLVFGDLT